MQTLQAEHKAMERRIAKLETMQVGECPTCAQPITDEHREQCLKAARHEALCFANSTEWGDTYFHKVEAEKAYQDAQSEHMALIGARDRQEQESYAKTQEAGRWDVDRPYEDTESDRGN